jgi:hypothetical protein
MRIFQMSISLAALAVVALVPAYASAQVSGTPAAAGKTAPSGTDTPAATVPGTVRLDPSIRPSNVDAPLPTVDGSGANRSNSSTTGEVKAPIGAPRLPGEPSNPPTGPND